MSRSNTNGQAKSVRCAIYTRKSTEEGLQQEFNSLDAQREAGEAFVASQRHEGWLCLPDHYDDGGFTGGNMDRPGLKRLMADIEAKRIDCVVVHRVDRLSRSLMDFSRMIEAFDKHGISFVSVTQQFNTTHSMGRLTLNILLSFAQFEREIISERTRDKIAATRRKGKWSGGRPVLGYDVVDTKLVINASERIQVRKIFELYLERQAIMATIAELDQRGWRTKRWTTKKGTDSGGIPYDKSSLHSLLTNVLYVGKVRYKDEVNPGEHEAIVDPAVFERVQSLLNRNHRTGGAEVRNQFGALLKGLLRCVPCGCSMTPSHTTRKGKRYRYYTCLSAQKRGWDACPSKSIPAGEIEQFVVDQIRCIGTDPGLVAETLAQARGQAETRIKALESEGNALEADLGRYHAEIRTAVLEPGIGSQRLADRLADLQERIRLGEQRVSVIRDEVADLRKHLVDEDDVRQALAGFDPVWEQLSIREQTRVLHLLIERVDYDGRSEDVAITFHPSGIKTLAEQIAERQESAA